MEARRRQWQIHFSLSRLHCGLVRSSLRSGGFLPANEEEESVTVLAAMLGEEEVGTGRFEKAILEVNERLLPVNVSSIV